MENILYILFLLVLGFAPTIIKIVKGEKDKKIVPPSVEEFPEEEVVEIEPNLRKTRPNLRNSPEYFTYDNMSEEEEIAINSQFESQSEKLQVIDNKEESPVDLQLDAEELYKGVIYSEILNRKY